MSQFKTLRGRRILIEVPKKKESVITLSEKDKDALMYEEMYNVFIEDIVVIIAVERGMMPLVFKRKIDPYVKPLVKRINTFYRKGK